MRDNTDLWMEIQKFPVFLEIWQSYQFASDLKYTLDQIRRDYATFHGADVLATDVDVTRVIGNGTGSHSQWLCRKIVVLMFLNACPVCMKQTGVPVSWFVRSNSENDSMPGLETKSIYWVVQISEY